MQTMDLMADLEFHDQDPYAQPLYVDQHVRALRFTLKPGQSMLGCVCKVSKGA